MDRLYEQNIASARFCVIIKEIYLGDIMAYKKQKNIGRMNKKVFDKLGKEDQINYKLSRNTLDKPVASVTFSLSPYGKKIQKRRQVKKKGAL